MRLTTVILIATLMQVSASGFGQRITYVQKEATILDLIKAVKAQTGINTLWPEKELMVSDPINANFRNVPVEDVIKKVLEGRGLKFVITDKTILISRDEPSFRDKVISFFTAIDVRGSVLDENNEPLVGAIIKIKGSSMSTITNSSGGFLLRNVDENARLVISFIGFETQEVKASKNVGTVKLMLSTDKLQEVEINAGYYSIKDRERTGSILRVDANTISKQPVNNVIMALQNRVPGMEIVQTSGVPGGGFRVQIRGKGSLISGTNPLYVIDGVVYPLSKINSANSQVITEDASPLSLINPGDIESVEVLKDADATAIYGSRGANGVVLITTKRGSSGNTKVNFNVYQSISEVGNRVKLLNTEQYIAMRMEAFRNDGISPAATDVDVNGTWDKNRYTDWQEKLIGGTSNGTTANLNVSGGNKSSNYLVGGNYYREGTVFPGDFNYSRGGAQASINFGSVETKLTANFTANYSRTTSHLPSTDPVANIAWAPNAPDPLDAFGKLNWYFNDKPIGSNPMTFLYNTIDANTDNLIANAIINYKIIKGLNLKGSVGYNTLKRDEFSKRPNIARDPATNPTALNRTSQFANNFNNSWIAEPQINYEMVLRKSKINALLGMSFQQNQSEFRNIQASNFNSDELMENIGAATTFTIPEINFVNYKYTALFTRVNYSHDDKYFINLTGRRDGSSRFGPNKRFANFGAVGLAWIFTEEGFVKNNLPFLSFGKLRVSYGITGNDQVPDYGFLQLYNTSPTYQGISTLATSRIANPEYSWETNNKAEVALQLGFLQEKINLQIAHYVNRSSDQLVFTPLPSIVGTNGVFENLPATVQNAGWELEGNFKVINDQMLMWSLGFNLTIPKNKLLKYPGLADSRYATTYIIGQPTTIKRFYNTTVDPKTGVYLVEDFDKNGQQNDADMYLNKFIGQIFYGGLNSSLQYGQFNLDFLFSFTKQNGNSSLNGITYSPGFFFNGVAPNPLTIVLDRWQNEGDKLDVRKFSTTGTANFNLARNQGKQSVSDDSFMRLKNISLSYQLPKQWITKLKLSDFHFSLQGQNLFTITKYKGLDPELNVANRLPALRTISLGLKLTL
jgi:TonB-linked SusC/RagA family outer membrane protein